MEQEKLFIDSQLNNVESIHKMVIERFNSLNYKNNKDLVSVLNTFVYFIENNCKLIKFDEEMNILFDRENMTMNDLKKVMAIYSGASNAMKKEMEKIVKSVSKNNDEFLVMYV